METNNKNIEDYFPKKTFRPRQKKILHDITNSLESDKEVIILEGPTGFGKSPVNIALGKYFKPTFYTTPQIKLVNQIAGDFCPKELAIDGGTGNTIAFLGRKNYICRETGMVSDICPIRDGHDINGKKTTKRCSTENGCTYWKQKIEALKSDVAIITFAMLITNTYLDGDYQFSKRNLLIVDECHSLESQIAGMFAGFTLSPGVLPKFKREEYRREMWKEIEERLPKSKEFEDYLSFFYSFEDFLASWVPYCETKRQVDKLTNLSRKINYMLQEIDEERIWVIDTQKYFNTNNLSRKFTPILIDRFLQQKVWSQANKIVLSSATIPFRNDISVWLERLGLKEKDYDFHSVPMDFPLKNRQIITSCIGGKMTYAEENKNWEGNVNIIKEIIRKHNDERGVIHTQSYKRAERLYFSLKGYSTFLHNKREINGDIIEEWNKSNKMVLISPAIKDGVDLKDDMCRFQILLKVPYPNIKDARVNYLLNVKKDRDWYNNETAKDIIQTYGRAVRSPTDYAKFYIIDGSFRTFPKKLFPRWFLDALYNKN